MFELITAYGKMVDGELVRMDKFVEHNGSIVDAESSAMSSWRDENGWVPINDSCPSTACQQGKVWHSTGEYVAEVGDDEITITGYHLEWEQVDPSLATKEEVSRAIQELGNQYSNKDMKEKINEIIRTLCVAVLAIPLAVLGVDNPLTVETSAMEDVLNTQDVVTGVQFDNEPFETLSAQVSAIGAHLNGEDARWVCTNYNSSTKIPESYVEIKVMNESTSSNEWLKVWREMNRWNLFTGEDFDWNEWHGFMEWKNDVDERISEASPKEYAFYNGVNGEVSPDGFFWIGMPRIAIAANMAYQRYMDGWNEVWILESQGLVTEIGGNTNGYFRITDEDGNSQVEIIKGDKQTIPAYANSMHSEVNGVTHWFTTYAVTNAVDRPMAYATTSLSNPHWIADIDDDCPIIADWTMLQDNKYQLEFWAKSSTLPQVFVKAEYNRGGETIIRHNVPTEMQYIIIDGVKYSIGVVTISGNKVLKLTESN